MQTVRECPRNASIHRPSGKSIAHTHPNTRIVCNRPSPLKISQAVLRLMREREECDSGCSGSPSIWQALCYNPRPEGGTMDIISQLKEERAKIAGQLSALDAAITALSGLDR